MSLSNDPLFYHMESSPRRFPEGMELQSIGYLPQKKDWIKRSFDTLNYSFILTGKGYYSLERTLHPIQAPAVLTQSPGMPVYYGPESTWEEIFFIYPANCHPWFKSRGLLDRAYWKIETPGNIRHQIENLLYRIQEQKNPWADQIDLAVERLIMDSLMESSGPRDTPLQMFIYQLHDKIENNCSTSYDFHSLAAERGFIPSGFRRAWKGIFGLPPGQVLIEIKMGKACRLLAETDRSVGKIADDLGFSDPLYFSKLFKKKRGESPRLYRKRTRDPFFSSSKLTMD